LKEKLDINIDRSDIVAMHRIPGRPAAPRPILIKFLRMESKIALLRRKKDISEIIEAIINWLLGKMILIILLTIYIIIFYML
jgi:hypothetical protein